MFSPSLTSWQAHYARYRRSLDRLNADHRGSVDYMDDLHHFMQDCWHLKDWIKADQDHSFQSDVEARVRSCRSLMIVADLANAAKHFVLNRSNLDAKIISQGATVHVGEGRTTTFCVVALGDGTTMTAEQVVSDAVRDWETLLDALALDR
ncbi:hypothetical protein ACSFA0_24930 [Variovorax sp. LT1P1]|uniref:hypothetical protein n=1 Tax=Variovorax sp. LT1P1 TaxID=3443730 RepID=UPI003F459AB0